MEKEEYYKMYNLEDTYWWYVGLRRLVFSFIEKYYPKKDIKLLDAGCGTGGILKNCPTSYYSYGIDFSEDAITFCKLRGLSNVVRGSICSLPFKENLFDIVISLDVLCHKGVYNDVNALKEFYKVMKKDGILILNLAAYNFLSSKHDKAVHAKERYTIKSVKKKVEEAGFIIEFITYRNIILFPFILIKRIIEKIFKNKETKITSELKPLPNFLNKLLTWILYIENLLIKAGLSFPFGLSVFCIAKKSTSIKLNKHITH